MINKKRLILGILLSPIVVPICILLGIVYLYICLINAIDYVIRGEDASI